MRRPQSRVYLFSTGAPCVLAWLAFRSPEVGEHHLSGHHMVTVVLLGTLDTKGKEYDYLRARLVEQGVDVVLVDAGVFEPLAEADVSQDEVAAAAGTKIAALREAGARGAAVDAMG